MIKFCSLFSGSSGNALFFSGGKTRLLIDAGLSGKRIVEALCSIGVEPSSLSAILVSHEHIDHVKGAGVISRRFGIPIYANEAAWNAMETEIGPVEASKRICFSTGEAFHIGDVCVNTFSIPHDAKDPVGFNLYAEGKKVTVATDMGHVHEGLLKSFEDSDLLLLESNHDLEMLRTGPYPWYLKKRIAGDNGHLSNDAAGKVVAYMANKGTTRFLLGHLSRENNFPELAYQTVCNALEENRIRIGKDVLLDIALRDRAGKVIEL
jgi:phosphoribosyl 1,2-cyclic phosphodiesterase